MKKFLKVLLAAAPLVLSGNVAIKAEEFVRIASGPSGGSWYPLGAKMAEIFSNIEGIAVSNGPGGGVSNVLDTNKKEAEIGWTYGHTAFDGLKGNAPTFKSPNPNIRHLATLYPAGLQTVVPAKSDIKGYADLKNKNMSPGKLKWSGYAAAQLIFGKYGFTADDVKKNGGTVHHVGYSDSVSLMKDGHIDAFTALTSVPQASLLDLEFSPGVRFLGIDQDIIDGILKENPGYIKIDITKDHYKSIEQPVPTLGAVTIMVVNKDVPDDVVYKITKALWDNHAELAKVKKVWNSVKLENALLGAALEVHPGAKKFYDEKGVK
jgi:TRAP transporter TAXI family solute receptor